MKLVIGNKNYSSWSMRPWFLLKQTGIVFEEHKISLAAPDFAGQIARFSPAGRVPVLIDGAITVWDSLAICEYLAEKFPDRVLWPRDVGARAHARAICAEMHAGFSDLRSQMAMNLTARLPGFGWNVAVQRDIDRITTMWRDCLERYGGPFLFGTFSIADAYYAPVVSRFVTYDVQLPESAERYVETIWSLPATATWIAEASLENEFITVGEPYRLPVG
jgi:glutathione S-transferase